MQERGERRCGHRSKGEGLEASGAVFSFLRLLSQLNLIFCFAERQV